jgi:hypothetical protein
MLHFYLYDCLFYKEGKSHDSDASCRRSDSIKAALEVVQAGCTDYQNSSKIMKIVS